MPDEAMRKSLALEYARRMNSGDVDAVLELFSDDVIFEDPVGTPPIVGKKDLRRRIAWSMKCNVHETPGHAVTSMDDRWVVVPSTVSVFIPEKLTFHIIGVMEIGDDGLTRHVRAFWGVSDTHVGDGPQPTGVAQFMAVTAALTKMGDLAKEITSAT
jgi:steroid Delta-isomerase